MIHNLKGRKNNYKLVFKSYLLRVCDLMCSFKKITGLSLSDTVILRYVLMRVFLSTLTISLAEKFLQRKVNSNATSACLCL